MPKRQPVVPATALILFTTLAPAVMQAEPQQVELNQAQQLVFMGEHLRQTHKGETLVYAFTSRSGGETVKSDEVKMTVTGVVDEARRNLSFEFLTGPDRLNFPNAQGYRGNPVVIQFLERDIRDMAQHTGTSIDHLRNTIRKSFREPQMAQTRVTVGGKQVDATEIIVVPFSQDPVVAKLGGYAGKEYLFIYSDQIPGDLIRVRTRMSDPEGTMVEEELRFSRSTNAP